MASNFREQAFAALNFTPRDLRDPAKVKALASKAAELKAAATRKRTTDTLRQATVVAALEGFTHFRDDSDYGPTVKEVHARLVEQGYNCKQPAVNMHLAKLRSNGLIDAAPKLKLGGGQGRPENFWFITDEAATEGSETAALFASVATGAVTVKMVEKPQA